MRRVILSCLCIVCVFCIGTAPSHAGPITLTEKTLDQLLGAGYTAASSLTVTDMSDGNLVSNVSSRAYVNNGLYAYLYQVDNTGTTGNSSIEMFTLGQFAGSVGSGEVGYLSGTSPTGFLNGGQLSEPNCFVDSMLSGLEISFYYGKDTGTQIDVGECNRVLYIVSTYSPGMILGSVIDHDSASGPVVGAVPEPGTFVLLALGGWTAMGAAWIRRRRLAR